MASLTWSNGWSTPGPNSRNAGRRGRGLLSVQPWLLPHGGRTTAQATVDREALGEVQGVSRKRDADRLQAIRALAIRRDLEAQTEALRTERQRILDEIDPLVYQARQLMTRLDSARVALARDPDGTDSGWMRDAAAHHEREIANYRGRIDRLRLKQSEVEARLAAAELELALLDGGTEVGSSGRGPVASTVEEYLEK